ncbi:type II secretion system protein [Cytobacillus gottheilii]|uniref:type II secretion system protein n=1 Tax=Cytobacillus gottheilii TaxID=859144 RepID=UPI000834927B|nr:type II secretion system protein [Cytobacillus gottheilii]
MYTIVRKNKKGLILIGVIVVRAILFIIAASATPSIVKIMSNANRDVCLVNQEEVKQRYETHLALNGVVHSDVLFAEFLQYTEGEICPDNGEFRYVDGKVICNIHLDEDDDEEKNDGEVPFL